MNLEIILWIAAGILISETIFILWQRYNIKNYSYDSLFSDGAFTFYPDDWIITKTMSFLIGTLIIIIHLGIVGLIAEPVRNDYIYLLWELGVIAGIVLLFALNKLIVNAMEEKEDGNKRKNRG